MNKTKDEGQIMTPNKVVTMILDAVGYNGPQILDQNIMEPAFGDGQFLVEIVSRIVHVGLALNLSKEQIKQIIENNVFGIEKDFDLYRAALVRLNDLLGAYQIDGVVWANLKCDDTLKIYNQYVGKMDYVVGNPPYIRIHNIEQNYRDLVKSFQFANGTTDMYIVFYEIGIQMCKSDSGKLGFITPNSFLRNTSQKSFRNYLIENEILSGIYDFKDSNIFDGIGTYTCICLIDKNPYRISKTYIDYREYKMYTLTVRNKIDFKYFKNQLKNATWNLSSEEDIQFLEQNKKRPIKIKSIATVQNGIATNRDSVYVGKAWIDKDCTIPQTGKHSDRKKIVYFNGNKIESTILHRCVKASKFNGTIDNTYILFPYKNKPSTRLYKLETGKEVATTYIPYAEHEMMTKFPLAYSYLKSHWDDLETRDMDDNVPWYVFGRSQGLANSGFSKLVFKHVVSKSQNNIDVHILDEDVIVYSGIYVTIDPAPFINGENKKVTFNEAFYDEELCEVKHVLESDDFCHYCKLVGKDMSGGYVGISSVFVKNYGTELTEFPNLPVKVPLSDFSIADQEYMNDLLTQRFADCIKESYVNMAQNGITSTTRIKPFHAFLAKALKYKLGQDYDIIADGYSYEKEVGVVGNFDTKNVDVCIMKKGKVLGAIAFKLFSNNFKQNLKIFPKGCLAKQHK